MDIISYIHKSVALLFQILELVEVWTHRSMELSPIYRGGNVYDNPLGTVKLLIPISPSTGNNENIYISDGIIICRTSLSLAKNGVLVEHD
jgi:hypothetical protein